jgi:hypothetical protein
MYMCVCTTRQTHLSVGSARKHDAAVKRQLQVPVEAQIVQQIKTRSSCINYADKPSSANEKYCQLSKFRDGNVIHGWPDTAGACLIDKGINLQGVLVPT